MIRKYIKVADTYAGLNVPEGISCHYRYDAFHCPICGVETGQYLPTPAWETVKGKWVWVNFCPDHNSFSLDDTEFEMCERERKFITETLREATQQDHIRWMQHAFLVGAGVDILEAWRMVDGYGRWSTAVTAYCPFSGRRCESLNEQGSDICQSCENTS